MVSKNTIILSFFVFILICFNIFLFNYSGFSYSCYNQIESIQNEPTNLSIPPNNSVVYTNKELEPSSKESVDSISDIMKEVKEMYVYEDNEIHKLHRAKVNLITSCDSLKNHEQCKALKWLQDGQPANSRGWRIAQMATCSHRMPLTVVHTVKSLKNQVDKLIIYFNDGDPVVSDKNSATPPCNCQLGLENIPYSKPLPPILSEDWIYLVRSSSGNFGGNLGDRAKFYFSNYGPEGYRFVVDDDIYYPDNYVSKVMNSLDQFNKQVAVTVHCSWMKQNAQTIRDHVDKNFKHFQFARPKGTFPDFVNYGGTGAMSYHTSLMPLSIFDFALANMADIFFAVQCQKHHVPIFCIDRTKKWLSTVSDPTVGHQDIWTYVSQPHSTLEGLSNYLITNQRPWKVFRPVINGKQIGEGVY